MSEKKFMSYGDAETIFTGYANEIKNKVDWETNGVLGAKNILPQVEYANTTITINGVTITSREDGSVLLDGTSTAAVSYHFIRLSSDADRKFIKQLAGKKVTISGTNVSNTNARVQFWSTTTNVIADTTGKGTTFTIPSDLATTGDYNFAIWIPSGATVNNVVAYPMLRLASDTDSTYQPYAMTNKELTDSKFDRSEQAVLGAKNLLPYPYKDTAGTQNGVTYVYNSDNTITANGGATSISWRTLLEDFSSLKLNKRYILSGCPSGGSDSSYSIWLTYNDGAEKSYKDYGDGIEFTNTGNLVRIQVVVASGYTANNLVFKPMLRLASDPDDTYVPYAMTNKQLTDEVAGKQDILTFDTTPTNASTNPVTSGGIYTALGTKTNESMIGDAWTASTTYGPAGNTNGYPVYCINNNVLYKCIQEHTGAAYEPPNATYWEATDVNTEITALNNSLTDNLTLFGSISNLSIRNPQVTNNDIDIFDYKYLTVLVSHSAGYFTWANTVPTSLLTVLKNDIPWFSNVDRRFQIVVSRNFECSLSIANVFTGHSYYLNGHTLELDCGGNTSVTSYYKAYVYVSN